LLTATDEYLDLREDPTKVSALICTSCLTRKEYPFPPALLPLPSRAHHNLPLHF